VSALSWTKQSEGETHLLARHIGTVIGFYLLLISIIITTVFMLWI